MKSSARMRSTIRTNATFAARKQAIPCFTRRCCTRPSRLLLGDRESLLQPFPVSRQAAASQVLRSLRIFLAFTIIVCPRWKARIDADKSVQKLQFWLYLALLIHNSDGASAAAQLRAYAS
jgi:hypothetical protein